MGVALEVPGEAPAAANPRKGALDDPALGQNLEALSGIIAFYNLKFPWPRARHNESHFLAAVASVGEDALDEGEQSACPAQQREGAIAILDIGGKDHDVQQQTQRVDEDVPLATLDLLARVVA